MGRNIRTIALTAPSAGLTPEHTRVMFKLCEGVRDHIRSILSTNIRSWEIGHGENIPGLDEPLLDVVSLARRGPNGRLSPEEISLVVRTLRRTPEVMVKVSGGAKSTAGALAHLKYIDRHGDLELETDEGGKLKGGDSERSVVEDWELDVRLHD